MNNIIIAVNDDITDMTNVLDEIMDVGVKITSIIGEINIVCGQGTDDMMSELRKHDEIESVNIDQESTII
jgi:hypothetical protein